MQRQTYWHSWENCRKVFATLGNKAHRIHAYIILCIYIYIYVYIILYKIYSKYIYIYKRTCSSYTLEIWGGTILDPQMMSWNMTVLSHVVSSDFMWLLVSMLTVGVAAWYDHHPVVGYLLHLPIAGPRTSPFFGSVARSCFENGVQQQRCGNKKKHEVSVRFLVCSPCVPESVFFLLISLSVSVASDAGSTAENDNATQTP